ncbi:MAG: DUF4097 domain-containing protein [Terriglobia bacterium]
MMRILHHVRPLGNSRSTALFLPLALVALAATLSAQEPTARVYRDGPAWVEESQGTIKIPGGQLLYLRSERGNLLVRTGPAGEVRYRIRKLAYWGSERRARELFGAFTVRVSQTQSEVRIHGEWQRRYRPSYFRNFSVEYEITVPASFRADLETRGGDIQVEGLENTLRAVTAGGNIRTGNIGDETFVETMGGSITLGTIGGTLHAQTAGGDIRVEGVKGSAMLKTLGGEIISGHLNGSVRATTAGGDVQIEGATGDVFARTAGGYIAVGEVGGRVQAETAGGSILIESAAGGVEVQTLGGGIELERIRAGVRAATTAGNILARILNERKLASESLLETSFGDVKVYLLPELAVTIDAVIEMATSHKIRTDFPLKIEGASGEYSFTPRRVRAFGELNGGGQRLRIRTVGGDIVILKLTQRVLERLQEHKRGHWKRWQKRLQQRPPKLRPPQPDQVP